VSVLVPTIHARVRPDELSMTRIETSGIFIVHTLTALHGRMFAIQKRSQTTHYVTHLAFGMEDDTASRVDARN